MENQIAILRKIRSHQFIEKRFYWVDVTHIESPDEFYVRPIDYRDDLRFLQTPGVALKLDELQIGCTVSYKSEIVQCFIRGQVILIQMRPGEGVSNEEHAILCDLFALDYGFIDRDIPLWKIFKIRKYANLPPLSAKCSLANYVLKPTPTATENDSHVMKQALGVARAKMRVCAKYADTMLVDLNEGIPNDVSISIVQLNNPLSNFMMKMDEEFNEISHRQLRYIRRKLGDVLHVVLQHVNAAGRFFVGEISAYRQYEDNMPDFSSYCQYQQKMTFNDMRPGLCVAVEESGERYERAIVLSLHPKQKKVLVNKIDIGEVTEVLVDKLKPVKEQIFNHLAALAICCCSEFEIPISRKMANDVLWKPEFMIRFLKVGYSFENPSTVEIIPIMD